MFLKASGGKTPGAAANANALGANNPDTDNSKNINYSINYHGPFIPYALESLTMLILKLHPGTLLVGARILMYIEEIILEGFKSYATRTVIPAWDPKFNAITGLNGSGKSNILDAICFVLGIDNLKQVTQSLWEF